jgi:hypothetical protein
MYEEILKEARQAVVKKDWSTFERFVMEDFTWKHVTAGMTLSYDEFFTLVESDKILHPENQFNFIKSIEINEYVIGIYETTHIENGKISGRERCHDVVKMDGNKIKSIVVYNTAMPQFKFIEQWLNSLDVKYEVNNLIE